MKTMNLKNGLIILFCAAALAGLTACDADLVERTGGKQPDKEGLENTYGKLRSSNSATNSVGMLLNEGGGSSSDNFYYQLTKPAPGTLTLEAEVDPELLDAYNQAAGMERTLLPEANYEFPDGKTLSMASGKEHSQPLRIRFLADGLAPGEYALPIAVENAAVGTTPQVLYYNITIRQPQPGDRELLKEDIFFVFYINTSEYDPRIVTDYYAQKTQGLRPVIEVWYRTLGNIVNLRTVMLDYDDASGRALLNLGKDMRYILDNRVKYILPIQDAERKVCLCIEGGGKGLGFCNMNDAQIADFAAQVKTAIEEYGLDGVNLWDRNSGYGKEGMPAVNTTSYPKLIVALREALGADKLVTVVDHMEPTEYFWDTAATGGIEVGEYIDYAWSGYCSKTEKTQIVDPWHPGGTSVSAYTRKPIAGLDPSKYGCINMAWYKRTDITLNDPGHIRTWRLAGLKQNNILVTEDLITVVQGPYEGVLASQIYLMYMCFSDDGWDAYISSPYNFAFIESFLSFDPNVGRTYVKWFKDW